MVPMLVGASCQPASQPPSSAPTTTTTTPEVEAAEAPNPPQPLDLAGEVTLPGLTLEYAVHLEPDGGSGGGYRGTIDIPAQGVFGAPLQDVEVVSEQRVRFSLAVPGTATWRGTFEASGAITCSFSQGSVNAECSMAAESASAVAARQAAQARPQTPKAPFPYLSREVTYRNERAGIGIAGTLTIPEGPGPHPAALLITGSGAQDRDETIFGHKPFLVVADSLSRAGVAVLRVDDRGVGGTDAGPPGATSQDFADDVRAGLAFLRQQPELDPQRLGLIGHSEGGLIAPQVAADDPEVAFVVMLAGPGVSGREVLGRQVERVALSQGLSAQEARQAADDNRALTRIVVEEEDPEARRTKAMAQLEIQARRGGDAAPSEAQLAAAVATVDNPWFRYFLALDPRPALRRVRCPVLVFNGELDVQVDADQNLPAIRAALKKGRNRSVTIERLPGLNHLFQRAQTGAASEYATITHTFDEDALQRLTAWVSKTTGSRPE